MKKLGILGVAVLAGLGNVASADDPRDQISSTDNKQLAVPEAAAEANPAPSLNTRSSLAADDQPTGKSNVVKLKTQSLNLSPKRGLTNEKLESPKLLAAMASNPSKLAGLKEDDSKSNALDSTAERTQSKASNLQQVAPLKTSNSLNPGHIPGLDLTDDGGKS